jgi:hypothetical protein
MATVPVSRPLVSPEINGSVCLIPCLKVIGNRMVPPPDDASTRPPLSLAAERAL